MCDCNDKVNALLAEQNARLVTTLGFGGTPCRPIIQTEKLDPKKRGRSPAMLATVCPFCGEKYAATTAKAA